MEARLTAPLTERMLDLARVGLGMRVLDLASGRGEPAISAAHRVGPRGSVFGVDVSSSMLAMAAERATREGLSNLELHATDAASATDLPPAHFHAALARWGLMYMDAPVAALTHACRALLPRGLLVAAVWVEPARVHYFSWPRRLLETYRSLPPIDFDAPGTFYYADRDRLHRDLRAAGFHVEHTEELEVPVVEVDTPAELLAWTRAFGLTRLLNDLSDRDQRAWEEDLTAAAESLRSEHGIRLGGVTRIVVASGRA